MSKTGSHEETRRMLEIIGRLFRSHSDNRKSAIQNRKLVGLVTFVIAFIICGAAAKAQQPTKIPWIGYLAGAGSGPAPAFIDGLRDLGYVEAKNIGIVFGQVECRSERYADLVAEVIRLKVDVIVADGSTLALTVKKATSSIPIVVSSSTDPVGTGLINSMARPGGNVTGLWTLTEELGEGKRSCLRRLFPGLQPCCDLETDGSGE